MKEKAEVKDHIPKGWETRDYIIRFFGLGETPLLNAKARGDLGQALSATRSLLYDDTGLSARAVFCKIETADGESGIYIDRDLTAGP